MIRRLVTWYGGDSTHLFAPIGLLLGVIAAVVHQSGRLPGGWWTVAALLVLPKAGWLLCAWYTRRSAVTGH